MDLNNKAQQKHFEGLWKTAYMALDPEGVNDKKEGPHTSSLTECRARRELFETITLIFKTLSRKIPQQTSALGLVKNIEHPHESLHNGLVWFET